MVRSPAAFVTAFLVVSSLSGLVGCSTSVSRRADRYFEQGDLSRAVAAYEEVVSSQPVGPLRSRSLFFLALLYGSPEGPVQDFDRAQELFVQLVEENPGSSYASMVARSLFLERRLEELQDQVEELRAKASRFQNALAAARRDLDARELELAARADELREREADLRGLKEELTKTLGEKENREEQMKRLTEALDLLKRIDLHPQD